MNGPGEMADADFGYVGGAPGKVDLYVGKDVIKRAIPNELACDALVQLIKDNNRCVWQCVSSSGSRVFASNMLARHAVCSPQRSCWRLSSLLALSISSFFPSHFPLHSHIYPLHSYSFSYSIS